MTTKKSYVTNQTKLYPQSYNNEYLVINDDDAVETFTTNEKGNVVTNRRKWKHLEVTVIEGEHHIEDQLMFIKKGTRRWLASVYENTRLSPLNAEPNSKVTIIAHKAK
jgi:hypothetical protein